MLVISSLTNGRHIVMQQKCKFLASLSLVLGCRRGEWDQYVVTTVKEASLAQISPEVPLLGLCMKWQDMKYKFPCQVFEKYAELRYIK